MKPSPAQRYDFSWRRGNLAGLLVVCAVGGGLLGFQALSGRIRVGERFPEFQDRIRTVAERIDPNTATPASLQRLPHIGAAKAQGIVSFRQAHSPRPFRCAEDLTKVHGIGPNIVRDLAPYLTIPRGSAN